MHEDNSSLETIHSNKMPEFGSGPQIEMNSRNQPMSFSTINSGLDDDHDTYYVQVKPQIIFVKILFTTISICLTIYCLYRIYSPPVPKKK